MELAGGRGGGGKISSRSVRVGDIGAILPVLPPTQVDAMRSRSDLSEEALLMVMVPEPGICTRSPAERCRWRWGERERGRIIVRE